MSSQNMMSPPPPPKTTVEYMTKLSSKTKRQIMGIGLTVSFAGSSLILIASSTNHWIVSAEVLKFWDVNAFEVDPDLPEYKRPTFFKNATFGPWKFCWKDLATRKTVFFLLPQLLLTFAATTSTILWFFADHNVTRLLPVSGILHVLSGLGGLLTLVVYLSSVNQEVGKKLFAASPVDDPSFYYSYGYSFYCLIAGYLCVQVAAGLTLFVFMAKHEEQLYNRYQIRSVFKSDMMRLLQVVWNKKYKTRMLKKHRLMMAQQRANQCFSMESKPEKLSIAATTSTTQLLTEEPSLDEQDESAMKFGRFNGNGANSYLNSNLAPKSPPPCFNIDGLTGFSLEGLQFEARLV